LALAITVSWAITYIRVLVEVATLNAALLSKLWLPLVAAAAVGLGYAVYLYFQQRPDQEGEVPYSNPFELGTALKFGALYAIVLLVSRAAQVYTGDIGVYLSSVISGLPDADAVTLSMAQLSSGEGGLGVTTAARAVVFGVMSNTVAKGAIVLTGGASGLQRAILPGLILMLVVGIGVTFLFT
jgi:uncharacterized membrane protein (DUF4010 family)